MAFSGLTAFTIAAAGAVLAGLAFTQTLAEVTPYFIGGIKPEQRFAVIASGDFRPASSRWSRNLFLNDCLDVPRTIYGLAQPPARRDALFDNCRREAEAIVATTPTASAAWLVVAASSAGLGDFDAMLPALAQSRRTTPHLQWFADRRSRLAEAYFDRLDPAAIADYEADLATMAAGRDGVGVLAQRYVRQPERREAYQRAVNTAAPALQELFLRRVRAQLAGGA